MRGRVRQERSSRAAGGPRGDGGRTANARMRRRWAGGLGPGLALLVSLLLMPAREARAEMAGAFPHIEPWPSSLALGGTTDALGEGVEAVLGNPTGMLEGPRRAFAFSHASLFSGGLVRHQAAAVRWLKRETNPVWEQGRVTRTPGKGRLAVGLGITNLAGELPGSDTYGELQIALCLARRVLLGLQSGFRLRILQARSSVDGAGGGGLAFDFGLERAIGRARAGMVARSVVSDLDWDRSVDGPLPRGYDLGLQYDLRLGGTILAGASLHEGGAVRRCAVATSWRVPGAPLVLRAGPAWSDPGGESRGELSSGISLQVGGLSADYGMRTGPPGLGEIHRFALVASLP
ncbi:MAG: hypothetical protein FJY88_04235 [Candidatus Eisenbacteria bacterium]|nr:hypothetical protein [Candidatus Eisenbacteria bacterium]